MKITEIYVYQIPYKLKDSEYSWSGGHSVSSFTSTIVKVNTDEGYSGYAEICPLGSAYMDAFARGLPGGIEEIGSVLIGHDPCQIKAINDVMDSAMSGHNYIKAPLDIACWDILGHVYEMSVSTLLGGKYVESYPLYRAISQRSPEQMSEDVSRFKSEGYSKFQLKVGGNFLEDIERIRAVLKILSPEDILVADANTGWLMHHAIRVVNALADEDIYIEQPCTSLEECLVVREHTCLPMVLDEIITDIPAFLNAHQQHAMDAVNIKISRVGGLTRAKQLRDLCESLGVVMTLEDSWGGDITTATIAHLVASTKPESYFTSTDFNSYIDVHIAEDSPTRSGGYLSVPDGPGLGIHIDDRKLGNPIITIR